MVRDDLRVVKQWLNVKWDKLFDILLDSHRKIAELEVENKRLHAVIEQIAVEGGKRPAASECPTWATPEVIQRPPPAPKYLCPPPPLAGASDPNKSNFVSVLNELNTVFNMGVATYFHKLAAEKVEAGIACT